MVLPDFTRCQMGISYSEYEAIKKEIHRWEELKKYINREISFEKEQVKNTNYTHKAMIEGSLKSHQIILKMMKDLEADNSKGGLVEATSTTPTESTASKDSKQLLKEIESQNEVLRDTTPSVGEGGK